MAMTELTHQSSRRRAGNVPAVAKALLVVAAGLLVLLAGCSSPDHAPQSEPAETASPSPQGDSPPTPSAQSSEARQRAAAAADDDSTRQDATSGDASTEDAQGDNQSDQEPERPIAESAPQSNQGKRGFSGDRGHLSPYTPPPAIDGSGRKLLALYIVGSDLEEDYLAASVDLEELLIGYYALGTPEAVEVIVAFGGADKDGWRGMKLANIDQLTADYQDLEFGNESGSDAYLYQAEGAHMGDESSFRLFLDYLGDAYSDFDQRFLVMWDHGNSYKGFGNDSNFNADPLYLDEIERSFTRSRGGRFDVIGFDACLMATVEVARVVAPHADYMIASEALVPGHGWSWSDVIRLYADGDEVEEFGRRIVDNFVQDVHLYESTGKTISFLDLSRYDDLVAALDPVVAVFADRLLADEAYSDGLVYGTTKAQSFGASERDASRASVDLRHFAELLAEGIDDPQVEADLEALTEAVDRFVVHANHDGSMPNAHGLAIDAPENVESEYSSYKVNDLWWDFQLAFLAFLDGDTEPPEVIIDSFDSDGAFATVRDESLAGVSTLYGFVQSIEFEDGTAADYFMVVAEEQALPTEIEDLYLAPAWDQVWFTVEYNPGAETAWVPAFLAESFELEGRTYLTYVAEIELYQANKDYSQDELPYDLATLTLIVELGDYWEVVDYYVETYRVFYTSADDEEGTVQFDKATLQLGPGDRVQFWSFGFNLDDPAEDGWFAASDVLTFVQDPLFLFEFLEFEDADGWLLDYYYALWAEDASGNPTLSDLIRAEPIAESPYGNMLIFVEESGVFSVQVPQDWVEQVPDESQFEVFTASDAEGLRHVSIFVEANAGLALTDYADGVEQLLQEGGVEELVRETARTSTGLEVVVFGGMRGEDVIVWLSHVTADGTGIDITYLFLGATAIETGLHLAYYSLDTLTVYGD